MDPDERGEQSEQGDTCDENKPPGSPHRAILTRRGALLGMAAVGGVAAVDVGGFGYAGGWLADLSGHGGLTPARFADRFENVYGRHDGFRRNHAKGLSATGTFVSNGAAAAICRSAVFQPGSVPVIGRFSLGGGLPDQADKPDTVRGLGLLFQTNGQQWRTAMINIPVFTDSTAESFYQRLVASKPRPDTGKPDPQLLAAFLDRHPETAAAMKIIKQSPPSSGFADSTYYGLNAFYFTNSGGATVPVRWAVVPQEPGAGKPAPAGKDFLFDDLIRTVAQRPVQWRLMITVGEPGDPTHDPTKPWPPSRRTVDAGTITIAAVETEEAGNARDINFDPLVLPDGISASDDPIPKARSAVYARSFTRRAEEPKSPSAVNVARALS